MEVEKQSEPRIYFGFTPHIDPTDLDILFALQSGFLSTARGTVALTIVGDTVHFGIAICSEGDNFSRSTGRQYAGDRLKNGGPGSGKFKVPPKLRPSYLDDHDLSLALLDNMIESTFKNIKKKQRQIGLQRLEQEKIKKPVKLLTGQN